jgi:hypothetical protein
MEQLTNAQNTLLQAVERLKRAMVDEEDTVKKMTVKYLAIDVFCGAGGLSLGIIKHTVIEEDSTQPITHQESHDAVSIAAMA